MADKRYLNRKPVVGDTIYVRSNDNIFIDKCIKIQNDLYTFVVTSIKNPSKSIYQIGGSIHEFYYTTMSGRGNWEYSYEPFSEITQAAVNKTGAICKRCNCKNEYASPNQKDGSYVCYECR